MLIHCKKADWTVSGPIYTGPEYNLWRCVASSMDKEYWTEMFFDYNPELDVIASRLDDIDANLPGDYKRFDVFFDENTSCNC